MRRATASAAGGDSHAARSYTVPARTLAARCVRARQPVAQLPRGFVRRRCRRTASARSARRECGRCRRASGPWTTAADLDQIGASGNGFFEAMNSSRSQLAGDTMLSVRNADEFYAVARCRSSEATDESASTVAPRRVSGARSPKKNFAVAPSTGNSRIIHRFSTASTLDVFDAHTTLETSCASTLRLDVPRVVSDRVRAVASCSSGRTAAADDATLLPRVSEGRDVARQLRRARAGRRSRRSSRCRRASHAESAAAARRHLPLDRVDWERTSATRSRRARRATSRRRPKPTTRALIDRDRAGTERRRADRRSGRSGSRSSKRAEDARRLAADSLQLPAGRSPPDARRCWTRRSPICARRPARSRFDLSLVAVVEPPTEREPLLPPPTPQEAIEQTLLAARLVDIAGRAHVAAGDGAGRASNATQRRCRRDMG